MVLVPEIFIEIHSLISEELQTGHAYPFINHITEINYTIQILYCYSRHILWAVQLKCNFKIKNNWNYKNPEVREVKDLRWGQNVLTTKQKVFNLAVWNVLSCK